MTSQTWNTSSFERNSLSKSFNPSLSHVYDRGEPSRPGWIGILVGAGVRTSAMFAVLALSVASPAIGQTAASRIAEQVQGSPAAEHDTANLNANSSRESVTAPPTDLNRGAWHDAILNTPRPQETCSTATYPEQKWHEVPCETAPNRPVAMGEGVRPDIVGGIGLDLTFVVANGTISEGEGSFDKVKGVTSEESLGRCIRCGRLTPRQALLCRVGVVVVECDSVENRIEPRINRLSVGWKPIHGRRCACYMTR
jgi:hypothetical protein